MRSCLLIIDVQEGFINDYTKHIPFKIEELVNKHRFDIVVATRFMNNVDSPHYQLTNWKKMMNASSQKLVQNIDQLTAKTFDKSINSCFTDEFEAFLASEDITQIYLVGIDTDCCVLKTAFDCFDKKISFKVLLECCASSGGVEYHNAAKSIMSRSLGENNIIEKFQE